ncbi:MAG: formimidoylglutamate deiminase [Acidobacteriota bacterium]
MTAEQHAAAGEIVEAALTWTGRIFEAGVRVAIGSDGRIAAVDRDAANAAAATDASATDDRPVRRLPHHALLPGFVNAHSHGFQRALRGRGESFPAGTGDFWSWREAMYALVARLDPDAAGRVYRQAYAEMRAAGFTTVGEFHYLRHADADARDHRFDAVVVEAARDVGIRLVLMPAHYRTGDVEAPLADAQRRFATPDLDAYWAQVDRLAAILDPPTQHLAAVGHSLRAVPLDDVAGLIEEARRRALPLHWHVEEQTREIETCRRAYGAGPLALLTRAGAGAGVVAVHATQSTPDDLAAFLDAGGTVCLCPLTEANLADGVADLPAMLTHGGVAALSVGSDSNARIDPFEELRWLAYVQRLVRRRRGVVRAPRVDGDGDDSGEIGANLIRIGTEGGARALGLGDVVGRIAPGHWADLCAVDLQHPSLVDPLAAASEAHGSSPGDPMMRSLAAALVLGGDGAVVAHTCVAGRWR